MRIRDWSSDVFSSDLPKAKGVSSFLARHLDEALLGSPTERARGTERRWSVTLYFLPQDFSRPPISSGLSRKQDRTSAVYGRSVSVRVGLGGRGIITKNT